MRRDHKSTDWQQLPPIPRNAPGQAPAQRPTSQLVNKLKDEHYQEDTIYHMFECGRVTAEMVRPHVSHGTGWGGYVDATCLRIAALARQIQIKLKYPHVPLASLQGFELHPWAICGPRGMQSSLLPQRSFFLSATLAAECGQNARQTRHAKVRTC